MEYLCVESLDRFFDLFSVLYGKKDRKKRKKKWKIIERGSNNYKNFKIKLMSYFTVVQIVF